MLLIGDGSGAGPASPSAGEASGGNRGKSAATAMAVDGSDGDSEYDPDE